MTKRHLNAIGLVVAAGLLIFSAPAWASPRAGHHSSAPKVPDASVTWTLGASSPFGGTRFDGSLVTSSNRVYFLGFRTFADATDGSVWYYDVATSTYVDTGVDMKVPVSNYEIAQLRDPHGLGLYIFGGRDANAQIVDTVQVFYPAINKAFVINTDPWPGRTPSACISLPANGVVTIQGKAYVMGGLATSANGCVDETSAQTWIFDPMAPAGSRWSQGPNLNVSRAYVTPAVLGGRIFAIGGTDNIAGTLHALPAVESWKPPLGSWNDSAVADLPVSPGCDESQAFAFASGPLARGIVLANCGQWPNALPNSFFYSATSNTWSNIGALNQSRRNEAGEFIKVGTAERA